MQSFTDSRFQMSPIEVAFDDYGLEADKLSHDFSYLRLTGPRKGTEVSPLSFPVSPQSYTTTLSLDTISDDRSTSNYWHIPDKSSYLTSVAAQEGGKLCAIGSGNNKKNLFIYEIYPDEVTHHQTITLPEIHSLEWVSPTTSLGQMGNVLASGHRSGVAHLTLLPDSTSRDGSAEILKRYNHVKHLPRTGGTISPNLCIRQLELTSPNWACSAPSSLFTLCGDHLFLWEPNRSDVPLVMQKTHNTQALGLCNNRDGVFALGRKRGVCIRDIRVRDRVNSGLKPPVDNDEPVSVVSWNPLDGNQLAAVHDRRTIKIWDIRSRQPVKSYCRHGDTITSLNWSAKSELVSASIDGTVRVWDIEHTPSDSMPPKDASVGMSIWGDYSRRLAMDRELEGYTDDLLTGSTSVNNSRHFSAMTLATMNSSTSAVTIDSGGFLGIHKLNGSKSFTNFSSSSFSSLDSSCESDFLSPI